MAKYKYHLDDLTDNAYIEMICSIRQFIDDSNPALNINEIDAIEELYGDLFDAKAWLFLISEIS